MAKYVITAIIVTGTGVYAAVLIRDLVKNRSKIWGEPGRPLLIALVAPVIMFFATMGVSDFLMNTLFFQKMRLVDDKKLPGGLITAGIIPLSIVGIVYLLNAKVELSIIVVCMVCQTLGTIIGVRLVRGFSGTMVKRGVGIAMLVSSVFLVMRLLNVGAEGGGLYTFSVQKLVICGVLALFFGVCNMMGMGAKAPYMSLLLTLGLSSDAVLAVIMTACTMSSISGAIQFVRLDLYPRKIALLYTTFGLIGISIGFFFVTNLNQAVLQIIMLIIAVYTGTTMLFAR